MQSSKAPARPPMTLHDIVVDYVVNSGYAGTAKVLAAVPPRLPSATSSISATPCPEDSIDVDGEDDKENGADITLTPGDASRGKSVSRTPSPGPPTLDESVLASIDQRRAILDYILSGSITRAVDALHAHFPAVLTPAPPGSSTNGAGASRSLSSNGADSNGASGSSSSKHSLSTSQVTPVVRPRAGASGTDGTGATTPLLDHTVPAFSRSANPDHVRLNLQIQGFIELYRHLSPSAPPSPSSSMGSLAGGLNGHAELTSTLSALHNLHTEANRLRPEDRAVYLQEIKDVGGLLAYIEPETSVVSGFLDQQRRIALAQQINAAILKSEGRPVQSHLEWIVRRTHAVYATLHEHGIDPTPSWTGDAKGATHWRIAEQLKRRPFHKGGFNLREYVWETA